MTPTEKKYAILVGNLYWSRTQTYDWNTNSHKDYWNLELITGCKRRYGQSGNYVYTIQVIKHGNPEDSERDGREKRMNCNILLDLLKTPDRTRFLPAIGDPPVIKDE